MSHIERHPLDEEEIVLLSREIQAMINAGVPLDFGLSMAAAGFPERLEEVSQDLANQLRTGKSLPAALESESSIPPVYKAVLVAGLRCGRSQDALEDVCRLTMDMLQLRTIVYRGLIYPLVVAGLSLLFMVLVLPRYLTAQFQMRDDMGVATPDWAYQLKVATSFLADNGWGVLTILVALFAGWTLLKATGMFARHRGSNMWWLPGFSQVRDRIDLARTTRILSLLTKYDCPLPQALELVAQTSESPFRQQAFRSMANDVGQGSTLAQSIQHHHAFPPFLSWLIGQGAEPTGLSSALTHAAEFYRSQAATRSRLIQVLVPAAAIVVVGGGITLLYGLTIFGPMIAMLDLLSTPN